MNRIFLFCVDQLNYEKRDLNISYSKNRSNIGIISRMITNTIFLSHRLRQNILIRLFIEKPIPHYYQIDSTSIRYLGPEMRSSASILLKAENYVIEKINTTNNFNSLKWHTPNPGLHLRFTNDLFLDLELTNKNSIFIHLKSPNTDHLLSLQNLETKIKNLKGRNLIFLFNINVDLTNYEFYQKKIQNERISKYRFDNISFPSIISVINLILDDLENTKAF